jgi:hypothetical protein
LIFGQFEEGKPSSAGAPTTPLASIKHHDEENLRVPTGWKNFWQSGTVFTKAGENILLR